LAEIPHVGGGGAGATGVDERYVDDRGREHRVPAATIAALAAAIGRPDPEHDATAPLVVGPGWRPAADGVVVLEDGAEHPVAGGRAAGLPLGYHHLVADGVGRELIVAPHRCRQPARRTWGVAAQLYAARSSRSWGIGDLRDLGALHALAARHGAGFVLVNPLHASAPGPVQEACPYSPVSRLYRSPLYLSVPDVPGAAAADLSDLAGAAAVLNSGPRIDRDRVWHLKCTALERIRATGVGADAFAAWRAAQPPELHRFAVWCALSERYGPSSTSWPAGLRRFDDAGVAAFAAAAGERVDFHAWLQWLLALQQERFGAGTLHDVAVGVAPGGADPWIRPDAFVPGVTIGAPPDALNTHGQNWGMAPLHPWRLRADGYRPFAALLRAAMHGSAGVRIDHVLGLFRLWFVPAGADPSAGAYVRYPVDDLLAIVALESRRAGVPVVGEDLGTVEDGVRERLDERGVLSCRVLLLAEDPPHCWPAGSLATVTTHDLPTVAGLWTGTDLADQEAAGVASPSGTANLRHRLTVRTGVRRGGPTGVAVGGGAGDAATEVAAAVAREGVTAAGVTAAAHRVVGGSPSLLAAVGLEDLLGVEHRPNIPATQRPENWTRPLPVLVDELDGPLRAVAALLDRPPAPSSGSDARAVAPAVGPV